MTKDIAEIKARELTEQTGRPHVAVNNVGYNGRYEDWRAIPDPATCDNCGELLWRVPSGLACFNGCIRIVAKNSMRHDDVRKRELPTVCGPGRTGKRLGVELRKGFRKLRKLERSAA